MASSGSRGPVKAAIVAAAAALFAAAAQQTPVYIAESTLVTVPCVVTDSHGVPVTDLTRSYFHLFDNGVERDLSDFWTRADAPLTLGIVLDVSDSQRSRITEHESAAHEFLTHVLRQEERAFVVRVARDATLSWEGMRSPTGFRQLLFPEGGEPLGEPCGAIDGHSLCGGTALWNAVYYAARLKLAKPQGSKALVILSDGDDTGSTHSLDEAVHACVRAGVAVYAIRNGAAPGLVQLAYETGGADFAPTSADYSAAFARIESDLRAEYVLAFRPGPGGAPHTIRVEVTRPGLTVRSRTEYTPPY